MATFSIIEALVSHHLMLLQNHSHQINIKKQSRGRDSSVMATKGTGGLSYINRKMGSIGEGCCLSSISATERSPMPFDEFAERSSPDEVKEEIKRCYELVHKLGRGVVYLGSARVQSDQPHYLQTSELAREVGKLLNRTTWTGAGPGLMDAAIKGSFEANVAVGGFKIAKEANEWTTSNFHPYLPPESYFTCRFFSARKHALVDAAVRNNPSDMTAVIALPGGIGTLDEIFEILSLIQLERIGSKLPVPFLLMNYDSYYSKLLEFIRDCEQWGTVATGEVDSLWKVCNGNAEALEYLAEFYDIQQSKGSDDTDIFVKSQNRSLEAGIGVNYGRVADNLPPPSQVAKFITQNTVIDHIKIYDSDPSTLQAFAGTNIAIDVAVPNELIQSLTSLAFARHWVQNSILPYSRSTNITRILVGNEVISIAKKSLIASLVPAMQNLHTSLSSLSLDHRIKVSTPHSLGILSSSSPPSSGKFRSGFDIIVLKPLLSFLRATNSCFMVNAYPFFGFGPETLDYALFRPNNGVIDVNTNHLYTNMLDAQLDATFCAMKSLGFEDVEIVVAETGWPSVGDGWQVGISVENARDYNKNLVRHLDSGIGTPLMPNRRFDVYIFALFNENLKPGPISERNFGLFHPDMSPVYDIGLLKYGAKVPPSSMAPSVNPTISEGGKWCVPKTNSDAKSLQENIDYVCGQGVDCRPIQSGGACFLPDTVRAHAAYAMNKFYQVSGRYSFDCDFGQTGRIATIDPSYGSCKYQA